MVNLGWKHVTELCRRNQHLQTDELLRPGADYVWQVRLVPQLDPTEPPLLALSVHLIDQFLLLHP